MFILMLRVHQILSNPLALLKKEKPKQEMELFEPIQIRCSSIEPDAKELTSQYNISFNGIQQILYKEPEKISTSKRILKSVAKPLLIIRLFLYGFIGYAGLNFYLDLKKNQIREVQGIVDNSLSKENLEKRGKIKIELLKNGNIGTDLSNHLIALAEYASTAVVVVYPDPNDESAFGSGFIYKSNGIIITNHHVVDSALNRKDNQGIVKVKLYDGRTITGQVLGNDKESDLAAVKIDLDNLPILELATNEPHAGELVMAIGHPSGFGWSTSVGIVSASTRNIPLVKGGTTIQTDAAINHGNSGGPLLSMRGEVIALNESILHWTQNLGFSVSVSTMREVIPRLIN